MIRLSILIAVSFMLHACAPAQEQIDPAASRSASKPAVWRFEFVDTEQQPLGFLLLAFTDDAVEEPTCGNDYWKKMVMLQNGLDFDFGVEAKPAYTVNGPWLTIDLTASVCYIDHKLIGDFAGDSAAGFFNYSHALGGYNIGRFTARPYERARAEQTADTRG